MYYAPLFNLKLSYLQKNEGTGSRFCNLSNLYFSFSSCSASFFFSAIDMAFFFFLGYSITKGILTGIIEILNDPNSDVVNWLTTVI